MNIECELIRFERDEDEWDYLGLSPAEATAWRQAGFTTPNRVAAWWGMTAGPDDAARWRDAGFKPEDASEWIEEDFSLDEAVALRSVGFEPKQARKREERRA